jgi:diguanylate cyclase (GGDEF)-like protein
MPKQSTALKAPHPLEDTHDAAPPAQGEFVDSVGTLTDSHNKDALEITLSTVLFDLVEATRITLWRICHVGDGPTLRRCACVDANGATKFKGTGEEAAPIPIAARPHLKRCYDAMRLQRTLSDGANAHYCATFPIHTRRNVVWLVEVASAAPLTQAQERLAEGILRIFRNHVNVLEYGDCDELTGLANRRSFDDQFAQTAAASAGARTKSAQKCAHLAVLDIDFFKRVNDRYGHVYGDEVLVLFARLMTDHFNGAHPVFRFGGEEFVVLFPHATRKRVQKTLNRFRVAVSSFPFPQVGRVTVSIGHAEFNAADTAIQAFSRADAALYLAKEQGRNRVLSYEELVASGAIARNVNSGAEVELF